MSPPPIVVQDNVNLATPRASTISVQTDNVSNHSQSVQTELNILDEKNMHCGFEIESPVTHSVSDSSGNPFLSPGEMSSIPNITPLRSLSPFFLPIPGSLPMPHNNTLPSPFQFHDFENTAPKLDLLENNVHESSVFNIPSPPTTEPRPVYGLEPTIINLPSVPKVDPASSKIPVAIRTPPAKTQALVEESTNDSTPSLITRFPTYVPTGISPPRPALPPSLVASFVEDNNVPDGHVFPPGAEFIKSWKMKNDGKVDWPAETVLAFVGGNRLGAFPGAPATYEVGKVASGDAVDVWAGDLKAPEEAGVYNSFWRLMDSRTHMFFGHRVWITIDVALPTTTTGSDEASNPSLSSSTLAMPGAFFNENQPSQPTRTGTIESHATGTGTVSSVSEDLSLLNADSDDESVVDIAPETQPLVRASPTPAVSTSAPTVPSVRTSSRSSTSSESDDDEFVVVYDSASERL